MEGPVRKLSGFQKNHHPPDGFHPAAVNFIRRAGHPDIEASAKKLYGDIRQAFGYRRREFAFTCENGSACIRTPDFDAALNIDQAADTARNYRITVEVTSLHNPAIATDSGFHACFNELCDRLVVDCPRGLDLEARIDALEGIPEIGSQLEYDPDGSSLEFALPELQLHIYVTEATLTFSLLNRRDLGQLIRHSRRALDILAETSFVGKPLALH